MKKPKLTEGEWRIKEYMPWGKWSDEDTPNELHIEVDDISIAQVDPWGTGGDKFMGQANARAISAVPEMIDALMAVKRWMPKLPVRHDEKVILQKVNDALKKAGCTDE